MSAANYKMTQGPILALDAAGNVIAEIPADPANADYQAFLSWLGQGNTPLPRDPAAFDPVAAGVARQARILKRLAKTDVLEAIKRKEGWD